MGSLFGEILEPYTRALIYDEFDCQEYIKSKLQIEGQFGLPEQINTILFIELKHDKKPADDGGLYNNCLSICKIINAGIEILCFEKHNYLIQWTPTKDVTTGEVVQLFEEWFKHAKHIYTITWLPIGTYQSYTMERKSSSFVRILTNSQSLWPYEKLEPPNLISNCSANIFSFCIHNAIKCTLFIVYTDLLPYDHVNTNPLLNILKEIHFPILQVSTVRKVVTAPSSNNLYI